AGFTLGNNIFTTQYHPEMREDFVNALIIELENDLEKKVINKAFSSMKMSAHTLNFSEAIAQFFEHNVE
ncbi:MAG: type 1 glutamine amidotransferase, partial [Paracoccaceae bacterium]